MSSPRTYWHLQDQRRAPSEYDIVTSKLHYYTSRGFEVNVPLAAWYARFQTASPLRCPDWERFEDPRRTTYTKYVELQQAKEAFVDGMFRFLDETDYDDRLLASPWRARLAAALPPLRYPFHGLEMVSAYVAQMAPSGRITIAAMLQAADEMRRVHCVARRMGQVRRSLAGFGDDAGDLWQGDPAWQPLRELIERLLVCFDWGEALVALNLVVGPALDRAIFGSFARTAEREGDSLLGKLFFSLGQDGEWHRQWMASLVRVALEGDPGNRSAIEGWLAAWTPLAERAVRSLAPVLGASASEPDLLMASIREGWRSDLETSGLLTTS